MAATIALVSAGHNWLRYLFSYDGTVGTGTGAKIYSVAGATPDLITDSTSGTIKDLAKCFSNGYGSFAAGALTQAKARALWLSDWVSANPGIPATARIHTTVRTATGSEPIIAVDAAVDGSGHVEIGVGAIGVGATAVAAYVDVFVPGAIGF